MSMNVPQRTTRRKCDKAPHEFLQLLDDGYTFGVARNFYVANVCRRA